MGKEHERLRNNPVIRFEDLKSFSLHGLMAPYYRLTAVKVFTAVLKGSRCLQISLQTSGRLQRAVYDSAVHNEDSSYDLTCCCLRMRCKPPICTLLAVCALAKPDTNSVGLSM